MEIRIATEQELNEWWDKRIAKTPEDLSWRVWKDTFISENKSGKRKTFFAFENEQYIGQGTLLFESADKVMTGSGKAEIIKLELLPEFRGKGIATKICNKLESYAKEKGIKTLTIGVEPCEVRNMQIYFHWGFTNFLQCTTETYPPNKEGEQGEIITVLCYSKEL